MAYLQFITDSELEAHVGYVINIALGAKDKANKQFHKNVIDPFSAIFEMGGFDINSVQWRDSELNRKAQKTLQNDVGEFHQKVLGSVANWRDLEKGENVDLLNAKSKIIAEVKNKHNTVSGGKLSDVYSDLYKLITPKASKYHQFTAYFVNIIPKKANIGKDAPFTPPDRSTGQRCAINPNIRIIDGRSFYKLVTGRADALAELYEVLPTVIENVLANTGKNHKYTAVDKTSLSAYFARAFKN